MAWKQASDRLTKFLKAFPLVLPSPKKKTRFTVFTSTQLDVWALANGVYDLTKMDPTNNHSLNDARAKLLGQLNSTGMTPRWRKENGMGTGIAVRVHQRFRGAPTEWIVHPLEVAASHDAQTIGRRNYVTAVNRAAKVTDRAAGVDPNSLSKAERQHMDDGVVLPMQRMTIIMGKVTRALNSTVGKSVQQLEHRQKNSRLLK